MVVDVFTYNGEASMLDLHLNCLRPYVDKFIAVQAPTTFSGRPKPIYDLPPEVESYMNDENYTLAEIALAKSSPNTRGAGHWKHEFLQKERIKKALEGLDDGDMVMVGDVDEIWRPDALALTKPTKLKLKVYAYWLNNWSNEEFWGTLVAPYKDIKNECLNHLRTNSPKTDVYCGWHFTSMGGYDDVKRKLESSYTRESYWTESVERNLEANINARKDFLGRDFVYNIDESEWPRYLKDNKLRYRHLLYGKTT